MTSLTPLCLLSPLPHMPSHRLTLANTPHIFQHPLKDHFFWKLPLFLTQKPKKQKYQNSKRKIMSMIGEEAYDLVGSLYVKKYQH